MAKVVESAIGIFTHESNKLLKSFKVRIKDEGKEAKVEIKFKGKSGEMERLVKSYKSEPGRSAVIGCVQAICKYWPKFDPSKHRPSFLSQDEMKLTKKKKRNKA